MCISSTTMKPSVAENHIVHVSKLMHAGQYNVVHERSASYLSTESNSEFEFHSFSFSEHINHIEPPLSPKLLNYSPKLYSPNYSLNKETTAEMASSNQFSANQRNIPASIKADHVQEQQLGFKDYIEAPAPAVSRINNIHESVHSGEEIKKRVDLGSLLNRRDLKQLSPVTNYINIESNQQTNKNDIRKLQVVVSVKGSSPSSSSASPSSSPINYRANHSANPCKFEDNQAGTSPSDHRKIRQKKSRKWAFKLDFFRKGAYQALTQNRNDEHDHCSNAEEAGFDNYSHERDNGAASAAGEGSINIENYGLNQRITLQQQKAAVAAREARFNHQSIDNNGVAAAVIAKFESPARHSTSSVISSVSSSPRRAQNEMIRANHRKISTSAPISPAGSPPRSSLHAGERAFTRGRSSMSPHALHYEQQRARWEALRRKTFLPYRQSLLSACFYPTQAVYSF